MTHLFETFSTPFGRFSVAVDRDGALVATAFGERDSLLKRDRKNDVSRDPVATRAVKAQVLAYFEGESRTFTLPLAPAGTSFQQSVWAALQRIPFGETRSYGELAKDLGRPNASRAVGRANATNPICLVVPCHRVIGADGALTGFAFGNELKRRLLAHEKNGARGSNSRPHA